MSLLLSNHYNGLELGLQRRINFEFNLTTSTPLVLRFTSSCCYRIISRQLETFEGSVRYNVITDPTVNTVGTTPVPIYRLNTKVITPIQTEILSGFTITGGTTVDSAVRDTDNNKAPSVPPDYQLGGRIFTENDVFFLQLIRRNNQTARGFLRLVWQEGGLSG